MQSLVMAQLAEEHTFSELSILHVAPERVFAKQFRDTFGSYTSADLAQPGVDLHIDLRDTGLSPESYDVVYASHVLEHIPEDRTAIAEIRRILRPGGFAVLAVPIVCPATVDYPYPVPTEWDHVRGPGPDYVERYEGFEKVDVFVSSSMDELYQPWMYEKRSHYPTAAFPFRTPSPGKRHEDIVAVCYKSTLRA
jgi:SAM-dependent methyltransferase